MRKNKISHFLKFASNYIVAYTYICIYEAFNGKVIFHECNKIKFFSEGI